MFEALPTAPWWAASLVANFFIFRIESINRLSNFESFFQQIPATWWMILIAQWGLFRAWNDAPGFMVAWAWFTSMNLLLRLYSTHFIVGEPMNIQVWLGTSLIFGGMMVVKWGTA